MSSFAPQISYLGGNLNLCGTPEAQEVVARNPRESVRRDQRAAPPAQVRQGSGPSTDEPRKHHGQDCSPGHTHHAVPEVLHPDLPLSTQQQRQLRHIPDGRACQGLQARSSGEPAPCRKPRPAWDSWRRFLLLDETRSECGSTVTSALYSYSGGLPSVRQDLWVYLCEKIAV